MNEVLCYTDHLIKGEERTLEFLDILLDDTWCGGRIVCPPFVYSVTGDTNRILKEKQSYEFLLRVAAHFPVRAIGTAETSDPPVPSPDTWEAYRTDCYVVGKYQELLSETGYFDPVVESLLVRAPFFAPSHDGIGWLEKMISRSAEYDKIHDNTEPILIYRGDTVCYNILNQFADELASSLARMHQRIEVFDSEKEGNAALTQYVGRHFKAVIGIQTYLFSVKMQDKTTNLHDLVFGPKFNMILDHPAWMRAHIQEAPRDYYLLLHDRDYIAFVRHYFPNVRDCYHFSPAGILPPADQNPVKLYDVTFIGTYRDYRDRLKLIGSLPRRLRFLTARFLGIMKRRPNLNSAAAFQEALAYYGMEPDKGEFLELFYEARHAGFCVMCYYREKIIRSLIDADIQVHVYGASWDAAPFGRHPNLIRHPIALPDESMKIMQQSRISLNIMSWHKDGFTERAANSLLCKSVLLSDRSTQLEEGFENGQELVLFDLEHIEALPGLVKKLLSSPALLDEIAARGYRKAFRFHQWINRAGQLLDIIDRSS